MAAPRHPAAVRPWTVWTPLGLSLAVVAFLAARGRRPVTVRVAALVLGPLSVPPVVATTALATVAI